MNYPLGRFPQFAHQARASEERRERAAATQAYKKHCRIRRERQQIILLCYAWDWLGARLKGREATAEILAEVKDISKTIQRAIDGWDDTKYNQKKLDSLSQRVGTLALHYGLLDSLLSYVDLLRRPKS